MSLSGSTTLIYSHESRSSLRLSTMDRNKVLVQATVQNPMDTSVSRLSCARMAGDDTIFFLQEVH